VAGIVESVDVLEHAQSKPAPNFPLPEQLIFSGSTDWTPEQAENYIDWRIQLVDAEIARLRQQLDDLTTSRKRWLAVTGGRSKTSGNGHGNGHSVIAASNGNG
jgi:hypothetical protein